MLPTNFRKIKKKQEIKKYWTFLNYVPTKVITDFFDINFLEIGILKTQNPPKKLYCT